MQLRSVIVVGILHCLLGCSSGENSSGDPATTGSTSGVGGSTSSTSTSATSDGGSTATSDTTTGDATTSSGAGGTAGTGMSDPSVPADDSAESITAFLESAGFEQEGWLSVHPVPREPDAGSTSPHGMVRVYLSRALVEFKEGEPDAGVSPEVPGAMAVKEFYDDPSGSALGYAVMFYAQDSWTYYCWGPQNRCASGAPDTTSADPQYGNISDCRFCHGGNVYTALPQ